MKKITLILASLGLLSVSSAFAGHLKDAVVGPTGIDLVALDTSPAWAFGFEGQDVMMTNHQYTFGQVFPPFALNARDHDNKTVGPHPEWGGSIDIDYLFAGSSRDIKFAYTQLDADDGKSVTVPATSIMTTAQPLGFPTFVAPDGTAKGIVEDDIMAADLVFGQMFSIGDRVDMHPFAGVRWVDMESTNKARYYSALVIPFVATFNLNNEFKQESRFEGIGPRFGLDASVHVGSGISVVTTVGASVLVGDLNAHQTNNFYGLPNPPLILSPLANASVKYRHHEEDHVVPEIDARLGLDYAWAYSDKTSLDLQVGYQAVDYFNAVDLDALDAITPNTVNNSSDFAYHGPYVRAQLTFI